MKSEKVQFLIDHLKVPMIIVIDSMFVEYKFDKSKVTLFRAKDQEKMLTILKTLKDLPVVIDRCELINNEEIKRVIKQNNLTII